MIRSLIALGILVVATFFLPVWAQLILYAIVLCSVKYGWGIIIPALLSDAWYAPVHTLFSLRSNMMTLLALCMVLVYTVLIRSTRISQQYGLEKK